MADIQIITDAGSDLLKEEQQRFGIEVIPIKITADCKDYLSGVDVFSDEFYELLETCKEIPHTSQPSTGDIYDVFQKHIEAGKQILVISLVCLKSIRSNICCLLCFGEDSDIITNMGCKREECFHELSDSREYGKPIH